MFACKRNSCRSQMAEGFARSLGAGSFEVVSAGLESSIVNSTAVEVMREAGIDISGQTSKPLSDFQPVNFDVVISLCGCGVIFQKDGRRESCSRTGLLTIQTASQSRSFEQRETRLRSVFRNCSSPKKH